MNLAEKLIEEYIQEIAVTRQEWEAALKKDTEDLAKYKGFLKKLEKGEKVSNLTLTNAKLAIQQLELSVKNKTALLKLMK